MTNRQTTSFAVRSAVRRSSQLGSTGGVVIAVGVWLSIGVYGLAGSVLGLARAQAAQAFLIAGLVFLPTALSWAELMSWVRGAGGSYRLVRAAERPVLTLLSGLAHMLGWTALTALLADTFARYAEGLWLLVLPPLPDHRLFAVPLVLFFAVANLTAYRSRRRLQIALLGAGIVVVVLLAALMAPRAIQDPLALSSAGSSQFFTAVALLAAATWATNVTFEMQSVHRHPLRVLLAGALVGPGVALLLMTVARRVITPSAPGVAMLPVAIVETVLGPLAAPVILAIGLVVTVVTWQVVSLASLRQIGSMGYDGWLPDWLSKRHPRYRTPGRVVLLQSLLVLLFVGLGSSLRLGQISALALLGVGLAVNAAAFLLADHPDAEKRPFRLPLGVLIPAMGLGTNVLLMVALPPGVLLLGALWTAVGFAVLWRSGRVLQREAQRDVTVFQEAGVAEEEAARYTVLVPVADPEHDVNLLAFGEAVARQRGGCVIALHVVQVPDQLRLESRRPAARERLQTLERVTDGLEQPGDGVSFRALTRLSRGVAQGILDTMAEEDPDLIVMGWHARPSAGGSLGHILDRVVGNAPADVAVVRGDWPQVPTGILVPTRGGQNAPLAAELAQALTYHAGGQVTLLNVVRSPASQQQLDEAAAMVEAQIASLPSPERVVPRVIVAENPVQGILAEADSHDAVMLGASEESFLDQALFGQVPELIARQTDSAVAMVRRYRGLPAFFLRKAWESANQLLPTLELEDQLAVYARLRRGARPSINFFVLITLSAIIATLGLLLNSPAVIIGAMLVAPLMTPIVATAIGISFGDVRTMRLSLESTLQGVLVSIFISILVAAISPLRVLNSEILARTQPTLLDLGVALASGMAGAYAIARKEVGEALPGVAIAAALMPPVCTIGIGVALVNWQVAGGATLLFVTNLIAITLAAAVVFLLLGVRPPEEEARRQMLQRGLLTSAISLLIVSLPLAYILFRTTARDQLNNRVSQTVETVIADWENAEVESLRVDETRDELLVTTTLRTSRDVSQDDAVLLDTSLEETLDRSVEVQLFVVPVTELNSAPP